MKYIKLIMATALLAVLIVSCDRDLPYPLEDVKRGVVIDIVRTSGSDGVLSAGTTEGNFKVNLQIPTQQGDYSNLDYAQLVCVYTDANGEQSSKVVVDKVAELPIELTLDMADIYSKLGLVTPSLGEILQFTTNAVLKDGYVVSGWNQYSGFNNSAFAGWQIDGRDYSASVRYSVACQLILDEFERTVTVDDAFWEESYEAQIIKKSETELELHGMLGDSETNPIVMTVDLTDHSVSIKKQVIVASFSPYTNLSVVGSGTIDACSGSISFNGTFTVDQGSFGTFKLTIR